jgi:hypothetical protein
MLSIKNRKEIKQILSLIIIFAYIITIYIWFSYTMLHLYNNFRLPEIVSKSQRGKSIDFPLLFIVHDVILLFLCKEHDTSIDIVSEGSTYHIIEEISDIKIAS